MEDINKIKEDLIQQLENIRAINAEEELAYERKYLAFRNLRWIPVFTNLIPKNSVVFRTRTHNNENLFNNRFEISNPPNKIITKFARLNRPFQSVFYGSENRPTSYMELVEYWAEEKEIGEEISVSIGMWEFQRDINVMIIPRPNKEDRITDAEIEYGNRYDRFLANGKFNEIGKVLSDMIFDFMSKEYMRPAKKDKATYTTTTAYSNLIMLREDIDGILYPSVPFGGNGYNLALRKNLVENGDIKLIEVTKDSFTIGETDNGKHHFLQTDSKTSIAVNQETGEISWE